MYKLISALVILFSVLTSNVTANQEYKCTIFETAGFPAYPAENEPAGIFVNIDIPSNFQMTEKDGLICVVPELLPDGWAMRSFTAIISYTNTHEVIGDGRFKVNIPQGEAYKAAKFGKWVIPVLKANKDDESTRLYFQATFVSDRMNVDSHAIAELMYGTDIIIVIKKSEEICVD